MRDLVELTLHYGCKYLYKVIFSPPNIDYYHPNHYYEEAYTS